MGVDLLLSKREHRRLFFLLSTRTAFVSSAYPSHQPISQSILSGVFETWRSRSCHWVADVVGSLGQNSKELILLPVREFLVRVDKPLVTAPIRSPTGSRHPTAVSVIDRPNELMWRLCLSLFTLRPLLFEELSKPGFGSFHFPSQDCLRKKKG